MPRARPAATANSIFNVFQAFNAVSCNSRLSVGSSSHGGRPLQRCQDRQPEVLVSRSQRRHLANRRQTQARTLNPNIINNNVNNSLIGKRKGATVEEKIDIDEINADNHKICKAFHHADRCKDGEFIIYMGLVGLWSFVADLIGLIMHG
jgi:hypothetical protein